MRLIIIALLLITIILASGCLGEKTVIKANITITEHNNTPVIEIIDVTSAKVGKTEDYREASPHLPGVYMRTTSNLLQIDYWRSVDYIGSGEYELISELREVPEKGDRVDVNIKVIDSNGNQVARKSETIIWT